MKEKIKDWRERVTSLWEAAPKNSKRLGMLLLLVLVGGMTFVFADEGHEETAEVQAVQSKKVAVRTVGDVDPDGISQEGLNSFYGEVTSNDIGAVYSPREGVVSSWNVSVGDAVTVGKILGYVTVTTLSAEQQQSLAEQQAAAMKAQLDYQTAQQISQKTKDVFSQISERTRSLVDKQKNLFVGSNSTTSTSFVTELNAIESNKKLLEEKVQAFARTSLVEIFHIVGQEGVNPLSSDLSLSTVRLKPVIGQQDPTMRADYSNNLQTYVAKVKNRNVTLSDIQRFIDSTVTLLSGSVNSYVGQEYVAEQLKDDVVRLSEIQADFRELSSEVAQSTIDFAGKQREQLQVDIDASKQIAELDNQFSLQLLDQEKANQTALNEARAAEMLANKLATASSGVVPIVASRSGIVGTIEKSVGSYVSASDRIGLVTRNNPTKLVRFTIPASWKDINKGDTLSVGWRPEYGTVDGKLSGVSPLLDSKGGYQAELVLPKETVFPIGASVRLVPNSSKKGVFVNTKAVSFDGTTPFVWIVTEENILRKQQVTPGRQLGEYVEVIAGIEKGFKYLVILDPTIAIETGMNLDVLLEDTATVENASTPPQSTIIDESQPHSHE